MLARTHLPQSQDAQICIRKLKRVKLKFAGGCEAGPGSVLPAEPNASAPLSAAMCLILPRSYPDILSHLRNLPPNAGGRMSADLYRPCWGM